MMQWIRPHARRACMFSGLIAVLMGCSDSGSPFSEQESTFEMAQSAEPGPVVVEPAVEDVTPVVGTVTLVPDTDPKTPVTTGGTAIPVIDPNPQIVPLVPVKVGRFTEIAPDTAGGATFKSSPVYEYDMGKLVSKSGGWDLAASEDDEIFIAPVKGWVRYPEKALNGSVPTTRFPVIVFEHGMGASSSYKGYDYLAEELATHGYVVISINADANNFDVEEGTSIARAQLILGTLDRLREIDKGAPLLLQGESVGMFSPLKNKLDFTRIGIMGHSRGGQGVSTAIKLNPTRLGTREGDLKAALMKNAATFQGAFPELAAAFIPYRAAQPAVPAVEATPAVPANGNIPAIPAVEAVEAIPAVDEQAAYLDEKTFDAAIVKYNIFYAAGRETVRPYDFKGAFMLAPTDFDGNLGMNNVPLANLLPSCDGDVSNLDGAIAYDHNRFGPATDTAPRYQILVHGANHDFYNRIWGDDGKWSNRNYCDDKRKDSIRLSRADEERNGLFIINSFMRYHVGGEQKFAAYWNGTARMPDAACASGKGPCDERVMLTVQKDIGRRKLIQSFDDSGSLERNRLGGSIAFSGFDTDGLAQCAMPLDGRGFVIECTPARPEGFNYGYDGKGFLSIADHAELSWSKSNAVMTTDLTGISAKGTDSLTFRIAVIRPIGQEMLVTLADSAGKTATVTASDFSDALYNLPRPKGDERPMVDHSDDGRWTEQVPQLLNMVAIPLKAFEGVDTTSLKELKLVFPKESGKVAITDIELQNLGREKVEQTVAAKQ